MFTNSLVNKDKIDSQNKISRTIYDNLVADIIIETVENALMTDRDRDRDREERRNMAVRPNDFLPQRYHGRDNEDPRAHVLSFGDYIQAQSLDQAETIIQRFKATLSGHARSWIETKNFDPNTWDTVRDEFVKYFTGSHSELGNSVKLDAVKLMDKENLGHYLSRLILLAKESFSDISGQAMNKILYPRFIGGLPNKLRLELAKTGERDLDELVKKGQLITDLDPSLLERDHPQKAVSFHTQQEHLLNNTNHSIEVLSKTIADLNLSNKRQDPTPSYNTHYRSHSYDKHNRRNYSAEREYNVRNRDPHPYERRGDSYSRDYSRDRYQNSRYDRPRERSYSRDRPVHSRGQSPGRWNDHSRSNNFSRNRDSNRYQRDYSRDRSIERGYRKDNYRDSYRNRGNDRERSRDRRDRSLSRNRDHRDRSHSRNRDHRDRSLSRGRGRDNTDTSKDVRCYKCGQHGHIATYCKGF